MTDKNQYPKIEVSACVDGTIQLTVYAATGVIEAMVWITTDSAASLCQKINEACADAMWWQSDSLLDIAEKES